MARARKQSDVTYNARRRYRRQAERYEKKAAESSGIEKSRYENLAKTSLEKSYLLYDKPTTAKGTRKMQEMSQRLKPRRAVRDLTKKEKAKLIERSKGATKSEMSDDEAREFEAQDIMRSSVGDRIYGALVDIWRDSGYSNRDYAIMDFFGVESMAEVLDAIEEAGIDIYADPESLERYDEAVTQMRDTFLTA